MKIARRRLARELVRLITKNPKQQQTLVRQAAAYLIANKQTNQAHLLIKDMARELAAKGHVFAEVHAARPLTSATRGAVKKLLQKNGAQTIELNEQIVPELLGGVVIRTATAELDASVRQQLNQISRLGV